jgi:hypothetical protein
MPAALSAQAHSNIGAHAVANGGILMRHQRIPHRADRIADEIRAAKTLPRKGASLAPLAGYICGSLSTKILHDLLAGGRSFNSALGTANGGKAYRVHYTKITLQTLVGFILLPDYPRETIVARLPFANQVVPAVSLCVAGDGWAASPMLVTQDQLLRHEGVELRADWIHVLVNLAAQLKSPAAHCRGVDKAAWMIALRWETWERLAMTWPQRCKDLAAALGLEEEDELFPNSLLRKSERLGLVRRDKKPA